MSVPGLCKYSGGDAWRRQVMCPWVRSLRAATPSCHHKEGHGNNLTSPLRWLCGHGISGRRRREPHRSTRLHNFSFLIEKAFSSNNQGVRICNLPLRKRAPMCDERDGMWSTSDRCEEAIDPAGPTAPAFAADDVEDIYVKWYWEVRWAVDNIFRCCDSDLMRGGCICRCGRTMCIERLMGWHPDSERLLRSLNRWGSIEHSSRIQSFYLDVLFSTTDGEF